jgi:hypothetical protein
VIEDAAIKEYIEAQESEANYNANQTKNTQTIVK